LGGSGDAAAIHRAIWAAGIGNRNEAFLYLNRLVADALRPLLENAETSMRVLDLGCGVGGTSTWLAQELQVQVTGVTISATQRALAQERAQSLGQDILTTFINADFCDSKAMSSLPV